MGVPRTPTETTLYARDAVRSGVFGFDPIAGTAIVDAAAAAPSPSPRSPWQDEQLWVNSLWPRAVSRGAVGRSIAPAAPSAPLNRAWMSLMSAGGTFLSTASISV